jgi:hypothetical protein
MLDAVVDPEARIAQPDMGSDPPRFPRCSCRKVVSGPSSVAVTWRSRPAGRSTTLAALSLTPAHGLST